MRKFFLFVLPAVLCTVVTQANSALWSTALPADGFDSAHQSKQLSVIAPQSVCEAAELRLQPSFTDSANTYLWITPAGQQIPGVELIIKKATKADDGKYTLKVLSARGETEQSVIADVKVNPLPAVTFDGLSSVCEGSVFSLTAKGNADVRYQWVSPSGNTIERADMKIEKIKLSDAGVYILNAEQKGCTNTYNFSLQVKPSPAVSFEGNTTVCESSPITLKAKQNSAVKYTWWKGQNALQQSYVFKIEKANFNNAGNYVLQAKQNGCVNSALFSVAVKPSFKIDIEGKTEICSGERLQLKANDSGEGAAYSWKGPDFSSTTQNAMIENAVTKNSGIYTLTVMKNGCSLDASVAVTVREKYAAKIIGNTNLCENGNLSLHAEKEGASYTWTLPDGSKQNGSEISVLNINKAAEGFYKLNYNAGICSDSSMVSVKVNAVSKPTIRGNREVCEGTEFSFTAENANGNAVWMFADKETYTGTTISVRSIKEQTGVLKLSVDKNGCIGSDSIIVLVKSMPSISITGALEACRFSPAYSLQVKEASNQKGIGSFSGDIISAGGEVSTAKEGVFAIKYFFAGKNGCSIVKNETIRIKKGIEVNAGADLVRKGDEAVQISALASDNYTRIEWTNIPVSESNTLRPTVKPDVTTTYKVTVTNAAGCSASDEVVVKVMKIKLANAFSPNGDGINDLFTFEGLKEYPNVQIQIFNGVGKQVFSAKGYSTPWDGRCNGIPVESGTYYYNISLNDGKQNAPIQGWIQLKR